MQFVRLLLLMIIFSSSKAESNLNKRALQKAHEKTQDVKWFEAFFGRNENFDQVPSLVNLVNVITTLYLSSCTPIILYDQDVEASDGMLLEQLFKNYPIPYVHGQITSDYNVKIKKLLKATDNSCVSYIMFMADVMRCKDILGEQSMTKIVIVARSSQWRVYEFLASEVARDFVNLLVIAQSEKITTTGMESPFILYTHKLYIDGLGSSTSMVLTSWIKTNFTRPNINLFPPKLMEGFAGHRFIIALANQPPFVIKRGEDENNDITWDGAEVRLVNLLAEIFNFTTDFREAKGVNYLGSGDSVTMDVASRRADLGIGGVYMTSERYGRVDISAAHSQDCASFITLTSTALPKYRAIMGPFHWTVWLALTFIYLFAIFPLALSDKHTLKHLIEKPEEIENMFWYVFGTFTNCFTFTGVASWGKSEKVTTRVLVGFYWIFTIITTACYTGSIIAFVTLPIYPETVDTTKQLLSGRFQIGTLDRGGWQYWFENSSDPSTKKLFKNIEFLPTVQSGLTNVTKAFFWPYAFLGSAAELDWISKTNFTTKSKRAVLHISRECFVPYGVSLVFTLNSVYRAIINRGLMQALQCGFLIKFNHDVEWDMMRSSTGKLLQANAGGTMKLTVEDRALTLDDTQGMFLLLGAGFVLGGASLLSEWLGGCLNFCKKKVRRLSTASIGSNPRSYDTPTPREKLNSIQYSNNRLSSIIDVENGTQIELPNSDFILHAEPDVGSDVETDVETDVEPDAVVDVHSEIHSDSNNNDNDTGFEDEIDRIFNMDLLFGESSWQSNPDCVEEITDNACNRVKNI